eukprot:GHVT01027889.1.p2 GENE.GHVT01027889.1~~GHVT01027889.1.p2  ORF type:complete len:110 (-),score=13.22 GHVT01027889.1:484-813(-)
MLVQMLEPPQHLRKYRAHCTYTPLRPWGALQVAVVAGSYYVPRPRRSREGAQADKEADRPFFTRPRNEKPPMAQSSSLEKRKTRDNYPTKILGNFTNRRKHSRHKKNKK